MLSGCWSCRSLRSCNNLFGAVLLAFLGFQVPYFHSFLPISFFCPNFSFLTRSCGVDWHLHGAWGPEVMEQRDCVFETLSMTSVSYYDAVFWRRSVTSDSTLDLWARPSTLKGEMGRKWNSIQFDSIQFDSIQFDSIQFDSIQFNLGLGWWDQSNT